MPPLQSRPPRKEILRKMGLPPAPVSEKGLGLEGHKYSHLCRNVSLVYTEPGDGPDFAREKKDEASNLDGYQDTL